MHGENIHFLYIGPTLFSLFEVNNLNNVSVEAATVSTAGPQFGVLLSPQAWLNAVGYFDGLYGFICYLNPNCQPRTNDRIVYSRNRQLSAGT